MVDDQANSHKSREARMNNPEREKVEKVVVTGEVIKRKKSLGRKFKDVFVGQDAKSVVFYVLTDVLIPAAKSVALDAINKGSERMIMGEVNPLSRRVYNTTARPRISYNSIRSEGYRPSGTRPPMGLPRQAIESHDRWRKDDNEIIISSKSEAETVLDRMGDIVDVHGVVSVADLYELIGIPSTPIDYKWGWSSLYGLRTRQVREGFLIDLPPVEVIA